MKLIYKLSGEEVRVGDRIQLREGETVYEVTYFREPHKASSEGKVSIKPEGLDAAATSREYFARAIGAEWIEREDRGEGKPEETHMEEVERKSNTVVYETPMEELELRTLAHLEDLKMGDVLPNGAVIIDIELSKGYVFALRSGTVQPFVIWSVMKDYSCYDGNYFRKLTDAADFYNEAIGR